MPTTDRRARDRASTRDRIVAAALHVLEAEGAAALTVRRIAADVEYTPPIVYQHFANKDALVVELIRHGYDLLEADLARLAKEPDVDRRLLKAASAYVRFARAHPHLYAAMNGALVDADERRRAAEPAIDVLRQLLAAWAVEHDVTVPDHDEACEIVWGAMYGMATLASLNTVRPKRAQRLAEEALGAILLGWRTAGSSRVA